MSSGAGDLNIENTNIKTAPGVTLDENQKTYVGCVLDVILPFPITSLLFSSKLCFPIPFPHPDDHLLFTCTNPPSFQLFAGRPSLKKLSLWADDATFEDPITIATGRAKYEPQWYGLQTAFSEIERLHHEVTSAGNPIAMDLKTRYVVKGIGKEQTIASKILIDYDSATGKITKVQDKWDGELPDSSFRNVSIEQIVNPWWWVHYAEGWAWWGWSFCWETRPWQVRGGC